LRSYISKRVEEINCKSYAIVDRVQGRRRLL
jgi:hypothetical protein